MRETKIEQANWLIYTSVEDMRSSLNCSWQEGRLDAEVLTIAISKAQKMGMNTKVKVLKSYLKKLEVKNAANKN